MMLTPHMIWKIQKERELKKDALALEIALIILKQGIEEKRKDGKT